jgi:hypothetical protein
MLSEGLPQGPGLGLAGTGCQRAGWQQHQAGGNGDRSPARLGYEAAGKRYRLV